MVKKVLILFTNELVFQQKLFMKNIFFDQFLIFNFITLFSCKIRI